jgi:hypothetical protein
MLIECLWKRKIAPLTVSSAAKEVVIGQGLSLIKATDLVLKKGFIFFVKNLLFGK